MKNGKLPLCMWRGLPANNWGRENVAEVDGTCSHVKHSICRACKHASTAVFPKLYQAWFWKDGSKAGEILESE